MRGTWQLAAIAAVAGAVLVISGFLLIEHGGSSNTPEQEPPSPTSTVSYGNAKITAKTIGGRYQRTVVVRVKNKESGLPLRDAKVTIHGEMTVPHFMRLYDEKLTEVSRGEYKGPYTLVMPGEWRIVIVATSKKGDTSTSALPVNVAG